MSSEEEVANLVFLSVLIGAVALIIAVAIVFSPLWGGALLIFIAVYRHFTSPQMKEKKVRKEFDELYAQAAALSAPDAETFRARLERAFGNDAIVTAGCTLFEWEGLEKPPTPPPVCNSIEGARYKDRLLAYLSKANDTKKAEKFADELIGLLPHAPDVRGTFEAVEKLSSAQIGSLADRFFYSDEFFQKLQKQLTLNLREQKDVFPEDYKGDNAAFAYLRGTPLLPLAERSVGIDLINRTHHMHVVAGSGWGKTTLLEHMISKDLEDDESCVIVIDNQRQIIPTLAHIDLHDVAYISPHHSLGINLFDVGYQRLRQDRHGEQLVNAVVELLEYVLGSLMEADLTPRQQLIFQYTIQLAIAVPGANIRTFLRILSAKSTEQYAEAIATLPESVQEFFRTEYDHDQYATTKKEIGWRIWSMMKNPTFARIFTAAKNPVDMFKLMEERRLILIDTDINLLSENGSSFFGRLFIAQILQAARRRFEGRRKRVYVYIDEAPIYFDRNLATMLEQARKANIGVILAHQDLDQGRRRDILSALMGNTATKFAGGLSDTDARAMASNMRTSADFIKEQPKHHFAAYIQGDGTYSVPIPHGASGRWPQRDSLDDLVAQMEAEFGYTPEPQTATEVEKEELPDFDEEIAPSATL